jgi:rare lipoprotein A
MVASWYGSESGSHCANGQRFDPRKLTAAHKSLPFGTRLRVTNPKSGAFVLVTVTDRGPFIPGRQLDLSRAAADAIGIRKAGVASVLVEFI